MKKKKVAVFANGWSFEFVQLILNGLNQYAEEKDVLVDIFMLYTVAHDKAVVLKGERNILQLPDLCQYDGAIVLANTFNVEVEKEYLRQKLLETGIPTICLEDELNGLSYMGSENYSGMFALAEHLFKDHNVTNIVYISGPRCHNEAQERLKAVSDAAQKYNVTLNTSNLFYTDWSYYAAVSTLEDYLMINGLPQAVICANDTMALGVCEYLADLSYDVPNDIIVTGFDGVQSGVNYYPSLTSVGRKWNDMGYRAIEYVLEQYQKSDVKRIVMNSSVEFGESCGCTLCKEKAQQRLVAFRGNGRKHTKSVSFDMHLRIIYNNMYNAYSIQDLHNNLSKYFADNRFMFESKTFFMIFDENAFNPRLSEENLLYEEGYPDDMTIAIAIANGQIHDMDVIKSKQLLPDYMLNRDFSRVLVYLPLNKDEKTIGYTVMEATEEQLDECTLYVWLKNMQQYIDVVMRNIQVKSLTDKLTILSNTDGLTGLYNRMGCNKMASTFYDQSMKDKKNVGIIMCDVDYMKEINDRFGHLQGDLALCTLARAIKQSVDDTWYACRYGGDEFLLVGPCETKESLQNVINTIQEKVKEQVKIAHAPFDLMVSVGGVIIGSDELHSFENAIKIADDRMYMIKSKRKAVNGGTIR